MQKAATFIRDSGRRRWRALLLPGAATLAFVAAAAAQAAEPLPVNWAGAYMGLSLGAGIPLHRSERVQAASGFTGTAFDLYPESRQRAGVAVGAHFGYNWQAGRWVYGLETDFNLLDGPRSPSGTFPAPPAYWPTGVASYTLAYDPSANYFASFRARFGLAFDRALVYATGGVAGGGSRGSSTLTLNGGGPGNPFTAPVSQSSRMKYISGAGMEYAVTENWSARLEYFFLNQSLNTHVFDNSAGFQYASRIRNENHILRFGLNYHFGEAKSGRAGWLLNAPDAGEDKQDGGAEKPDAPERYSVHGQTTGVLQAYPKFPARYSGPNSFTPKGQARFGSTTNMFVGVGLWDGGAVYLNPEIDEGYGLSNSVGAASYVNGAAAKVGRAAPYMRFQRYFYRQIIGLDGGGKQHDPDEGSFNEVLESTQNQLSGRVDRDRLILTIGKFSAPDVFDDNIYAHDPTTGFMNFGVNSMGAFDYAADSWGYTHGAALEWKQNWHTARVGFFQLSKVPNGPEIEPVLGRQYMGVAELEGRYDLFGQPGAIKFLAYGDNGYLSKIDEIVTLAYATGDLPPRIDSLRKRRFKTGGGINIKQQLMPSLGFFLRASMADGRYETVDYTDIDRSFSTGLVAAGDLWGRSKDEVGAAAVFSGLSGARVRYFANGGTSVYIGDGALSYAGEKNLEAYYKLGFDRNIDATFDYQLLVNPAHNSARGPINVFGLRLHAAF